MRIEIVALILLEDGKVLVEKRKNTKSVSPGAIVFPGGSLEVNESHIEAMVREAKEEMCIDVSNLFYICSEKFDCEKNLQITWYGCTKYCGVINAQEAEELFFIGYNQLYLLTFDNSQRAAIKFYDLIQNSGTENLENLLSNKSCN